MGAASSRLGSLVSSGTGPTSLTTADADGERFCGLENFGNTCYANSVLQALYGCTRFRQAVLAHYGGLSAAQASSQEDTLLTTLGEVFAQVATSKKRSSVVAPKRFIQRLRLDNELFRSHMHQDAHEFLNFVLNCCCDLLEQEERAKLPPAPPGGPRPPVRTWVHELFEGTLTNQTRCLWCEAITSRDEAFLDLSLEISPNSTLSSCLRGFSGVETLCSADKFHCDACGSLQEAQKRMLVKTAPPVLALHLKRFKYSEHLGRHKKLGHRVEFPLQLQLNNTVDGASTAGVQYQLFAVVIHVGSGPNHGHYVCLVKSPTGWLCIDDDLVDAVDESVLPTFFGSGDGMHPSPGSTPPQPAGPSCPATPDGAAPMATDGGGGGPIPPGSIPAPPSPLAPLTPLPGGVSGGSSSDAYILFYSLEEERAQDEAMQGAEPAAAAGGGDASVADA